MKCNIISATNTLSMEFSDDMDIATVLVLLECDLGQEGIALSFHGVRLRDNAKTLKDYGVRDDDNIYAGNPPADPETARMTQLLTQLRTDPYTLSMIKQNNPPLADAIEANDLDTFSEMILTQENAKREEQRERMRRAQLLASNPYSLEAQRALEEEIRKENVEQLRQEAMEHMPESFAGASIIMLYVDVVVNGHKLKAFVDSGAQMTIMSQSCAERCGITRMIDTRFQGMAVGVGSQKIIGRVHMYQLQVAGDFLPTSFSILENQPMDMLLGLDMLKRHRCIIDLQNNHLVIGTTGNKTSFLSESELPDSARLKSPGAAVDGSSSASGASGASGMARGTKNTFPDEVIERLMKIADFSRQQVVEALSVSDGDAERAASYLFSTLNAS